MKKILLLSGFLAVGVVAFADNRPDPIKISDAYIQKISPNAKYAVSNLNTDALSIFNLETGEVFSYRSISSSVQYRFGIGQCFSNNGIFVGGQTESSADYWKDGEWYSLSTAGRNSFANGANAICNDGSRICGILGAGEFSYDDDVLMVEPCIWNAEGDGYGEPVILPYPEKDFLGRVPQYVKAIDISGDGKIVIGEIVDATGKFHYPIIYKEDAEGNWSYEIPHKELLMPEGVVVPEYPGLYTGVYPYPPSYMTNEQLEAYNDALQKYYNGEVDELPDCIDYMSGKEKDEYIKVKAEYDEWYAKYEAWDAVDSEIFEYAPGYEDNTVRISNDGLSYGCTIAQSAGRFSPVAYHVWIFDINSDNITKYEQQDDLCLTYLANGGVAAASTPTNMMSPCNSFVLKDGEVTGMYDWINSKVPEYASWMKQNMEFEYLGYDEVTWDQVLMKEFITGHAVSNPDFSVMALSVQNIGFPEDEGAWDDPEFTPILGYSFIFDLNDGSSVSEIRPAAEGKIIYDLSGRKLKEVNAPGIYIINGEKKIVR